MWSLSCTHNRLSCCSSFRPALEQMRPKLARRFIIPSVKERTRTYSRFVAPTTRSNVPTSMSPLYPLGVTLLGPPASSPNRYTKLSATARGYSSRSSSTFAGSTQELYSSEILPSPPMSSSSPLPSSTSPNPATATEIATPSSPSSPSSPISYTSQSTGMARATPPMKSFEVPTPKQPPPRLGPNEGRSIAVRNGDLQGALLKLQRLVAENKIKSDHHKQKFHERKGLKKKRLRSERYRKRFKEGFKKMVGLVLEMKRQGL